MASEALENLNYTISIIDDEKHPMKQPEVFLFGDFRRRTEPTGISGLGQLSALLMHVAFKHNAVRNTTT